MPSFSCLTHHALPHPCLVPPPAPCRQHGFVNQGMPAVSSLLFAACVGTLVDPDADLGERRGPAWQRNGGRLELESLI